MVRVPHGHQRLNPKLLSSEVQELQNKLQAKIVSQDRAIQQFVMTFQNFRSGLNAPNRPLGIFLFLGPTGTGKTEVVRQLATALFGNPDAMLKIDCAELKKEHYIARLIGSPNGYVGFHDSPQITQAKLDKHQTKESPFSLVLFDEIERADDALFDLLLGICDSGKLTLGNSDVVDFSQSIIVMTSNLGAEEVKREIEESGIGFHSEAKSHENLDQKIFTISLEAAKKQFRPQFMNRIDRVVVFRSLPGWAYQRILDLRLAELQERLVKCSVPVVIDVTKSARKFLLDECNVRAYGGRELNRSLRKYLIAPLSNLVGSAQLEIGDRVVVSHRKGKNLLFKKFPGGLVLPAPETESKAEPAPDFPVPASLAGCEWFPEDWTAPIPDAPVTDEDIKDKNLLRF
jgi:ATP-dependent Clp protease ATP-binding subunit ClpB